MLILQKFKRAYQKRKLNRIHGTHVLTDRAVRAGRLINQGGFVCHLSQCLHRAQRHAVTAARTQSAINPREPA